MQGPQHPIQCAYYFWGTSSTSCKQAVGNVEHMIGFTVRQMHLEDRANAIDTVCQVQLFDHPLNNSQPAVIRSLNSIG